MSIQQAADTATPYVPAAGTLVLWGVNAETWIVIGVGLATIVYYVVSTWVKWKDHRDKR